MTEQSDDEPRAGALGDEALRLLSLVQDWATRTFPASTDGHTGSDCQWCPLCQFVAVLRGERPDVTERVAEAGSALVSAFRTFVETTAPASGQGAHRHADDDASARPRVQRINLVTEPDDPSDGD